ncbi:MAG: hypothetical protein II111_05630, partial [Oscillospiraceae bacterium]|nr:hypothetical protein [Oscillospiraceae bacterium]
YITAVKKGKGLKFGGAVPPAGRAKGMFHAPAREGLFRPAGRLPLPAAAKEAKRCPAPFGPGPPPNGHLCNSGIFCFGKTVLPLTIALLLVPLPLMQSLMQLTHKPVRTASNQAVSEAFSAS